MIDEHLNEVAESINDLKRKYNIGLDLRRGDDYIYVAFNANKYKRVVDRDLDWTDIIEYGNGIKVVVDEKGSIVIKKVDEKGETELERLDVSKNGMAIFSSYEYRPFAPSNKAIYTITYVDNRGEEEEHEEEEYL